jgi:hypothetical protein
VFGTSVTDSRLQQAVPVTDGCLRPWSGAVLSQIDGNGEEHPVGVNSSQAREEHYATIEKECSLSGWELRLSECISLDAHS